MSSAISCDRHYWGLQVAVGCGHLQEANHLLRDAGHPALSPMLEQEIEQALEKYKPACTLEHLKVSVCPLCGPQASCHPHLWQRRHAQLKQHLQTVY